MADDVETLRAKIAALELELIAPRAEHQEVQDVRELVAELLDGSPVNAPPVTPDRRRAVHAAFRVLQAQANLVE